jgi:lysophospholipase L1-like esterase
LQPEGVIDGILRGLTLRPSLVVISLAGGVFAGCAGAASLGVSPTQRATQTAGGLRSIDTPAATPRPAAVPAPSASDVWRYVALGDSYTIGTSVKAHDRWPNQLARALRPDADLTLIQNLATNGASTADVIREQLPELDGLNADVISLSIGVNDVVRSVDVDAYRMNLQSILSHLASRVPAGHVVAITTPDYTLTPAGSDYGDPTRQSARIKAFNAVLEEEASHAGMLVVDITPVSDLVPGDPTLVASDGLHPSGKQYAGWVELITPQVREMLKHGK